jgi:hypothetical protein
MRLSRAVRILAAASLLSTAHLQPISLNLGNERSAISVLDYEAGAEPECVIGDVFSNPGASGFRKRSEEINGGIGNIGEEVEVGTGLLATCATW